MPDSGRGRRRASLDGSTGPEARSLERSAKSNGTPSLSISETLGKRLSGGKLGPVACYVKESLVTSWQRRQVVDPRLAGERRKGPNPPCALETCMVSIQRRRPRGTPDVVRSASMLPKSKSP